MKPDTLLLRQVNPSWIQQGRVTSQVFQPTPKDRKKLSVYDGDQITPENSWKHFTERLGFVSVGVMAVTVSECAKENLLVKSDPALFPEHAVIDFTGLTENQIKQKAKRLKAAAETRSWLYQAENVL
jgi:hypothetical protein